MMNKSVFLSHPVSINTPLYGGAKDINISIQTAISSGDTSNSLFLSFPNHVGTHLDVPYHFFDNGKKLTEYDSSFWIFNHPICVDVPSKDGYLVKYNDVANAIDKQTDLLLIRTGYEIYRNKKKYWQKNPGLSVNLATELRLNHPNIRAVGIDTISITSRLHRKEGRKAHKEFLGDAFDSSPIILIEDMSLKRYTKIISQVIVAPLRINDADGAPSTIIAH